MGAGYGKELKQLLREAGCHFVRSAKGSHEIWYSPITNQHVTVVSNCKARHTANQILKDAGIDKKF
jgi:predicted RNA binding protein YcfA (HicA-like mRNA interferase family)